MIIPSKFSIQITNQTTQFKPKYFEIKQMMSIECLKLIIHIYKLFYAKIKPIQCSTHITLKKFKSKN